MQERSVMILMIVMDGSSDAAEWSIVEEELKLVWIDSHVKEQYFLVHLVMRKEVDFGDKSNDSWFIELDFWFW